ncbi:MAG: SPOR domain-containing protein [Marinilabiliales bacterium]|nr:MAG: SPOR domain-containing protein [Marinilabiliales bacterium]
MKICLIFVMVMVSGIYLSGQVASVDETTAGDNRRGTLILNQDERIDELVSRHIRINSEIQGMQGYRIRIFSQSGRGARQNATTARAEFFNKYSDVETYLDYDPPNFRVYVGDFRTRSEALKLQRKIRQDYPYSFIVSSRINLPPLD